MAKLLALAAAAVMAFWAVCASILCLVKLDKVFFSVLESNESVAIVTRLLLCKSEIYLDLKIVCL